MKRIASILLVLCLCLSFAACGEKTPEAAPPETEVQAPPKTNHFQVLYDYILNIGYFNAEEGCYFVQKQDDANSTLYFIAQNDCLRFLHVSAEEAPAYSYECVFYKDSAPAFSYTQEGSDFSAKATGQIDATGEQLSLPLLTEECTNCSIEDHYQFINESQRKCKDMVKEILEESSLPIQYEDILG